MCGGKEHSALYFVGLSEDDLIYLDPHYVKKAISRFEFEEVGLE